MLLIAVPVAIFHYASGRVGNGMIATGAFAIGVALLWIDLHSTPVSRASAVRRESGQEDDGRVDGEDDWLDRPTDQPLPAPFQAFMDELMQNHIRGDEDEQHTREQS